MRDILGTAKTVRDLLKGRKYSIDYYQREYKWGEKQIRELVNDLSSKFLEEYDPKHSRSEVADYPHYFLGSIIISKKENIAYLVDGQQRLTSLTLLLILLRNLQRRCSTQVSVDELVFSEKYGNKSFNIHVNERTDAMVALYEDIPFDTTNCSISVQNMIGRYRDLESCFPDEVRADALPYFVDWLLENVHIVEITAHSDDDAYTIFETMNDRGLSLSPTDMLKGYLLANIDDYKRLKAHEIWRERIHTLTDSGKEAPADCLKAWFRSQYSTNIRERKKGARPRNFDRIGTEFHRWIRDESASIGLKQSDDFYRFVTCEFEFYSRQYSTIIEASEKFVKDLEHIYFNARHDFTLQHMLLLAPLIPSDSEADIRRKVKLVAHFLDILLTWRLWNFRTITHSAMQYRMFLVMCEIRGLNCDSLAHKLYELLGKEDQTFDSNDTLRMHQRNRYWIHHLLARITDYLETQSGQPSRYVEYVTRGKSRYEIEHIWADRWDRHTKEFTHSDDFAEHRNRIGGLLLLPSDFNKSYGDLRYDQKLHYYNTHNLLARSLHSQCYNHNPSFLRFIEQSGLRFVSYGEFDANALKERSELYRQIAKRIWRREDLLQEA